MGLFEGLTWDQVGRLGVPDLEVRAIAISTSLSSSSSMGEKSEELDDDLPMTMQEEYGTGPGTPAHKLRELIDTKAEHVAEAPFNTLVSCLGIIARLLGIEREMELRRTGSGEVKRIVHPQSDEVVDTDVLPMEDRPAALEALVQHLPVRGSFFDNEDEFILTFCFYPRFFPLSVLDGRKLLIRKRLVLVFSSYLLILTILSTASPTQRHSH